MDDEIRLLGKKINISASPVLLSSLPDENWEQDWMRMAGSWSYENGYLIGEETANRGGILFSRRAFDCNVMISFDMASVPPATRDLNAVFCAQWNPQTGYLHESYVCGLNGWYEHKSGIERNPVEGNPDSYLNATTALYDYTPGKEIRMIAGAIDGHCFMCVDGKLVSELIDPHPLRGGHVGFSPYCTRLRIRNIEVRRIVWEPFIQTYDPEF